MKRTGRLSRRDAIPRRRGLVGLGKRPVYGLPVRRGKSKFGNVSCMYDGYTYDSRMEAKHAALLDEMRKAETPDKRVVDVKRQVQVDLASHGRHICYHIIDFLVTFADGHKEYHEVKGYPSAVWPIKRELYLAQETIPYVVIRPNGVWEVAQ